jgi:hypothetical protein
MMLKKWISQNKGLDLFSYPFFFLALLLFNDALIYFYGNATPYWDQWNGEAANLYLPWLNGSLGLSELLAPHNEHRIFTMRLLSLVLLIANGNIWNPLLEMYVNAAIHAIALTFFVYYVNRSIADSTRKYVIIFSIALFSIPFGWENTLAGFQSQFYLLLLFSFIFLWTIACERIFSFKWWIGIIAGVLCPLSLASGALTLLIGAFILLIRKYFFEEKSGISIYLFAAFLILLAMISIFYTPTIPYHASLKAQTIEQFISALMAVSAWPVKLKYSAFIVQAPIVCFTISFLTSKDWRVSKSYLYLVAIGGWVFAQFLTITYGRFSFSLSSRYLDLFAVGLVINFAVLLIFYEKASSERKKLLKIALFIWLLIIFAGMFAKLPTIFNELKLKRFESIQQEQNVRAYLCTGSKSYLLNKPLQHVPFPDIDYLKSLLDNPQIKRILPGNIYVGNSSHKVNEDGTPYCNFEKMATPFTYLGKEGLKDQDLLASEGGIIVDGWRGKDYSQTSFPGIRVIGSYVASDSDVGILKITLKKGDQIFYRTGPRTSRQIVLIDGGENNKYSTDLPISTDWSALHFSSPDLPEKFEVTLIDAGTGWGEWIAIGVKEKIKNNEK